MNKTVAILATGDEITCGDTHDTNSPTIAQTLMHEHIETSMHMHVTDRQADIESAINYLLEHNQALIIIGGLGPTSDDRTRYALANSIQQPLIFNEASWQRILDRFQRFRLTLPHESNKCQAYFPQDSHIIPNENGSADGCWLIANQKLIGLLPGPPSECLPMFNNHILPQLKAQQFQQPVNIKRWLLFGVSESLIATEMDQLLKDHPVTTAYRLSSPYIEFKIYYQTDQDLQLAQRTIEPAIQSYCLSSFHKPASLLLKEALSSTSKTIRLQDYATNGHFFANLTQEQLFSNLLVTDTELNTDLKVTIEGFHNFWQNQHQYEDLPLTITINNHPVTHNVPYRQQRTLPYAIEIIAHQILKNI